MNRLSATAAVLVLCASGLAAAQQAPPPEQDPGANATPPAPSTMPQDPAPSAASPSQSDPSAGVTDKKAQLKDCITQQRTNDPQMSEAAAKKVCKAAVNGAPQN